MSQTHFRDNKVEEIVWSRSHETNLNFILNMINKKHNLLNLSNDLEGCIFHFIFPRTKTQEEKCKERIKQCDCLLT